jgi:ankyrin repeat protein
MLDQDVQIDTRNDDGDTALHLASAAGCTAIVQRLLEKGADVNGRGHSGRVPLWYAIQGGHDLLERLLLEKGADVSAQDQASMALARKLGAAVKLCREEKEGYSKT